LTEEKTLSTRKVFEGQRFSVRIDTVSTATGGESTREIVEIGDAVVIIPVDTDDNVLLVKQYRKAVEKELLELPAGSIDPGEYAEMTVRRDLDELDRAGLLGCLPLQCLMSRLFHPAHQREQHKGTFASNPVVLISLIGFKVVSFYSGICNPVPGESLYHTLTVYQQLDVVMKQIIGKIIMPVFDEVLSFYFQSAVRIHGNYIID